ncbi:MAG: acyltransferase [Sandaracinus sp.]|nr:acyltransferase [Sandaracinus sp.]MCB9625032.1 acyltransferase [Sandaracinus sp.]
MSHAEALPSRPPSGETEAVSRDAVRASAAAVPVAKARWLALDLLRFAAVVLMVQGHVFYEVIDDSVRRASWYSWHGFVHGFTAPIFLFSSGMAFGVTTLGKWDEHTHLSRAVVKRFERYAILLGIGYLLQVGDIGLRYMMELPLDRLHRATAVNALQLIGVVLAFAEASVLLLRRQGAFLAVVTLALFGVVLAAPWTWDLTLDTWPVPVAAYVTSTTRSLFPIFPWAGFLLGGILVARFVRARRKSAKPGWMQLVVPLALVGGTLVLLGKAGPLLGNPFPDHNVWKAGPFFFVFRLGVVLLLLSVLCAIDFGLSKLSRASSSRAITLLQTLGAETLVVYVAHLLMIYGVFGLPGLKVRFPHSLGLGGSIALVTAVFASMVAFAWVWHETKKRHPKAFDRVRWALMVLVVVMFFAR